MGCGNTLSIAVRLVELPVGPSPELLDCHHVNPPRLSPGTFAVDPVPHGPDRETGTFVMSPGDVRGTRFVHDLVDIGCWSLVGWDPCLACDGCGALVASRTDDCHVAQETRFFPSVVARVRHDGGGDPAPDPFALVADWDDGPPDFRTRGWTRPVNRRRPELTATHWRGRDVRAHLYRDDPPA